MKNRNASLIAFLMLTFVVPACAEKPSGGEAKRDAELSRGGVVRIVFDLPGDDIGSQESQKTLEAIKARILTDGAGTVLSSGYGMGTMELVVAVNSGKSTEDIRRLVGEVNPDAKYRIVETTK